MESCFEKKKKKESTTNMYLSLYIFSTNLSVFSNTNFVFFHRTLLSYKKITLTTMKQSNDFQREKLNTYRTYLFTYSEADLTKVLLANILED